MSKLKVNEIENLLGTPLFTQLMALLIPTGDFKPWAFSAVPSGWIWLDGSTIGNAASGATGRANADTQALFIKLWDDAPNSELAIQDSTGAPTVRGESAIFDYNANKRLPLPNWKGLIPRGIGTSAINSRDKVGPTSVRDKTEDQIQDHLHGYTDAYLSSTSSDGTGGASSQSVPRSGTSSNGSLIGWTGNGRLWHTNTLSSQNTGAANVASGANGTPRIGAETRPSTFGVQWIMKL